MCPAYIPHVLVVSLSWDCPCTPCVSLLLDGYCLSDFVLQVVNYFQFVSQQERHFLTAGLIASGTCFFPEPLDWTHGGAR